jgi:hypothetical protein
MIQFADVGTTRDRSHSMRARRGSVRRGEGVAIGFSWTGCAGASEHAKRPIDEEEDSLMRFVRPGVAFAAACAFSALAAGCVPAWMASGYNSKDKDQKETSGKEQIICTDETPTGSHISRSRCYRRYQQEDRRAQDRATMEKIQTDSGRPALDPQGAGGGSGHREVPGGIERGGTLTVRR